MHTHRAVLDVVHDFKQHHSLISNSLILVYMSGDILQI